MTPYYGYIMYVLSNRKVSKMNYANESDFDFDLLMEKVYFVQHTVLTGMIDGVLTRDEAFKMLDKGVWEAGVDPDVLVLWQVFNKMDPKRALAALEAGEL